MNQEPILERPSVRALLDEGVHSGRVSFNQILEALGDDAIEDEIVEEVLEAFESRRIRIVEDDEIVPASTSSTSTPQAPASTSTPRAGTSGAATNTSTSAPKKKAAHADLDDVLAAIDRISALPPEISAAAIAAEASEIETDEEDGPAVEDALKQYLDRMARLPLLSQEEEYALARKVRAGGWEADEARQKLVESNLRLVVFMARKYEERAMLPLLDMVQEGTIGLLRAIDRFDPDRGHRLATYATWWIRQSINRALAEQMRSLKLPAALAESIQKLQKLQRTLSQQLGRTPSRAELAQASGLSPLQVEEAMRAAMSLLSLESPVGGNEDSELGESLQGGEGDEPAANLTRSELKRELDVVLQSLSERERSVLEKRFGLGEFEGSGTQSLEDVAHDLGLSRERVRQLEIRALRKLRRRSDHLRDEDEDDDI
jgi:RNA polymerase primary sigma factor